MELSKYNPVSCETEVGGKDRDTFAAKFYLELSSIQALGTAKSTK
jgi:hypothetical protein